jgi:hypothetical protein
MEKILPLDIPNPFPDDSYATCVGIRKRKRGESLFDVFDKLADYFDIPRNALSYMPHTNKNYDCIYVRNIYIDKVRKRGGCSYTILGESVS